MQCRGRFQNKIKIKIKIKINKQVCYMAKNAVQGPLEDSALPGLTMVQDLGFRV
jgi:hypothetical protein